MKNILVWGRARRAWGIFRSYNDSFELVIADLYELTRFHCCFDKDIAHFLSQNSYGNVIIYQDCNKVFRLPQNIDDE